MTSRKLLLVTALVLAIGVSGQNHKIDSLRNVCRSHAPDTSLVNTMLLLAESYHKEGKTDSALNIYIRCLHLSENLHFEKGSMNAGFRLGKLYTSHEFYDLAKAMEYSLSALRKAEQAKDPLGQAKALNTIGYIYQEQGNSELCASFYNKAIVAAKTAGDLQLVGRLYNNLANGEQDHRKAIEIYKRSVAESRKAGFPKDATMALENMSNYFLEFKEYDEALKALYECITINQKLGDTIGVSESRFQVAGVYAQKKEYEKALDIYRYNLKVNNLKEFKMRTYSSIADILTLQKKYPEAISYLQKAIEMAKQAGYKDYTMELYAQLANSQKLAGNWKAAFEANDLRQQYEDSLDSDASAAKIVELQSEYDKQSRERILAIENEAKANQNRLELAKRDLQRNALLAGCALLMILVFVSWKSFRNKLRDNQTISLQKKLVEEKQKEILDSINYAKRLQEAILPPKHFIEQFLPDHFILYLPKDVVAGDFYWAEKKGNKFLIAAADSTGHGVPGALVSVVCSNALNRAVKEFGISDPGLILDKAKELVVETFDKSQNEVKDGMDISLLCLDLENKSVSWSGAYNNLWYISQQQLHEMKADKQAIGKTDLSKAFTTHSLEINHPTTFYLFTDGFADQFGGPAGKKFKYKQFEQLLLSISDKPLSEQKELILSAFTDWKGKLEQVDDVCVIGLRVS